jgi:TonB family protein
MSKRILTSMAIAAALAVVWVAPAAAQAPVRVGGDIKEPRRVKDVKPVYPQIAQQGGVQGIVILEVQIGTDGKVERAQVLRSVPLLDQAALDAVLQWEYTPTLLNGQPVPVMMTVTVSFSLGVPEKPREVNPDPLLMQRPPNDVSTMLDAAQSLLARGLLAEAEATLQRALAALQAERIRNARVITGSTLPAAGAASAPVRVGGDIKEPTLIKRVDPVYPAGTAPAGVTIAEVVIGGDGRVTEVRILRPQGSAGDTATVAALRQWVFQPTLLNGVPVPVIMTVTIK